MRLSAPPEVTITTDRLTVPTDRPTVSTDRLPVPTDILTASTGILTVQEGEAFEFHGSISATIYGEFQKGQ